MKSLLMKLADAVSAYDKQSQPESSSTSESNGTTDQAESEKPKEKEEPKKESKEEPKFEQKKEVEGPVSASPIDGNVIINFFKENPSPTDDDFHSFCEENGFDTHVAESAAYRLAGFFVEFLSGGKGYGLNPDQFDPIQIEKGLQIESEHTSNPILQMKIVLDHLAEIPDYYDPWLEEMESMAKENGGNTEEGQTGVEDAAAVPESGSDSHDKGFQPGGGQGSAFDSMNQNPQG